MADGTIHPEPASKPLNKRQLAKAATRQKVLAAGKALFEAVGYEAATIRAIADKMGMSTGAIFANFEDKRALYVAVYGHPPLTPEQGRDLAATGRALWEVRPANWDDAEDPEAARAWRSLRKVLRPHGLAS